MATTIVMNEMATMCATVNTFMKELKKNEAYKGAKAAYMSLSHVLKEMKELYQFASGDTIVGYYQVLRTLGVTDKSMLTPKLLTMLAEKLTQRIDGEYYDGYFKVEPVWVMVQSQKDPTKNVILYEDGERVQQKNEDGSLKFVTKFVPIEAKTGVKAGKSSWTPDKVLLVLSWDRALRIQQYMGVIKAKDSKVSPEDLARKAESMYMDYVSSKFAKEAKEPMPAPLANSTTMKKVG